MGAMPCQSVPSATVRTGSLLHSKAQPLLVRSMGWWEKLILPSGYVLLAAVQEWVTATALKKLTMPARS